MRQILRSTQLRPRFCVYETTLRCNMRCRHCGSGAGAPRPDELTPDEALRVLSDLCDLGLERLTLSGGEPLLRKDWPYMARALRDRGVAVTMISNGYLFDEAAARTARDVGLRTVGFSIDGDEESHTFIRKIPDSYARIMRAIEICRAVGQPFSVVTHVSKITKPKLLGLLDLLLEKEPNCWQVQLGSPMGNMRREEVLDDDDLLGLTALFEEIYRRAGDRLRVYAGDCVGYYDPLEKVHRKDSRFGFWTGCMAGCCGIGIESNGNVRGCLSIQAPNCPPEGNVRETPLREIWRRPGAFAYNREFEPSMLRGFCAECEYGDICRAGCKSMAYATTGGPNENPICIHRVRVERGLEPRRPRTPVEAVFGGEASVGLPPESGGVPVAGPEGPIATGRDTSRPGPSPHGGEGTSRPGPSPHGGEGTSRPAGAAMSWGEQGAALSWGDQGAALSWGEQGAATSWGIDAGVGAGLKEAPR